MELTWPHAAAALVVELDRAYNAAGTAPVRVAAAARTGKEYWRLGWRPTAGAPVPLAWNPWHALSMLTEEGIVEAAVLYKLLANVETRAAAGDGVDDALSAAYAVPAGPQEEAAAASVWEVEGRTFGRRLARLGAVQRRHFYGGRKGGRGRWRTPTELGELLGRGGCAMGGQRINARLTAAEKKEYATLRREATREEEEWMRQQDGPAMARPAEPTVSRVMAAADGRRGGKEYLVEWSDGSVRWGPRPRMVAADVTQRLNLWRAIYEAEGSDSLEERRRHSEDPGAEWLATSAPMAVGTRVPEEVVAAAEAEGVDTPGMEMERRVARGERPEGVQDSGVLLLLVDERCHR